MIEKSPSDQCIDETAMNHTHEKLPRAKVDDSLQEAVANIVQDIMGDACAQIEFKDPNGCGNNTSPEYTNEHLEKALQDLRSMKISSQTLPLVDLILPENEEVCNAKQLLVSSKISKVDILEQEMSTTISYPVTALYTDDKNLEISPDVTTTFTQSSADRTKLNMHTSTVDMVPEKISPQALGSALINIPAVDEILTSSITAQESDHIHKDNVTASSSVFGIKTNVNILKPNRRHKLSRVPQRNPKSLANKSCKTHEPTGREIARHCKQVIVQATRAKYNNIETEESNKGKKSIRAWQTPLPSDQLEQLRSNLEREKTELAELVSTNNELPPNYFPEDCTGCEDTVECVSARTASDNTDDDDNTTEEMYEEQDQSISNDSDNDREREEESDSSEDIVEVKSSQIDLNYSKPCTNETSSIVVCKQSILNVSLRNDTDCQFQETIPENTTVINELLENSVELSNDDAGSQARTNDTGEKISESDEYEDTDEDNDDGYEDYDEQDIDEITQNLKQTLNKSENSRRLKRHKQMLQRLHSTTPTSEPEETLGVANGGLEENASSPDNCNSLPIGNDNQPRLHEEDFENCLDNEDDNNDEEENLEEMQSVRNLEEDKQTDNDSIVEAVEVSPTILRILESQKVLQIMRFRMPYNKSILPLFVTSASSLMQSLQELKKSEVLTETNASTEQNSLLSNHNSLKNKTVIPLIGKTVFGMGMRPSVPSTGIGSNTTIPLSSFAFFFGPFTNHSVEN